MMQGMEPREGTVSKMERRDTKAGKPMLVLVVKLAGSGTEEERVSFFEDPDVKTVVYDGDHVKYLVARKGNYWNGKNLEILTKETPKVQPAAPAQPALKPEPIPSHVKTTPAPSRPLHDLTADELEKLCQSEFASGKVEQVRIGQITNQVRYARIEQSLAELKGILREILALLERAYLSKR